MYSVFCNSCETRYQFYGEIIAFNDKGNVQDMIDEADEWVTIEDKNEHYCPKCHNRKWDTNEEYLLVHDKQGKLLGRSKM